MHFTTEKVSHSTNVILTSAAYIPRIIMESIIISGVMACNLLDSSKVSEEPAASVFKAEGYGPVTVNGGNGDKR